MLKEISSKLQSSTMEDELHKIHFTLFQPEDETKVRATLLVLHGMQEHSGRYQEFARFMANNGIAVVTYDHLGHGKTAESNENLGFFHLNKPHQQVVIDAENMANYLEYKFPYVPHFVLGHSMGSFITRCLLQVAQQRFDGAIIVGSGGRVRGTTIGKHFMALMNKISPYKRSKFINRAFSRANNGHFKNEPNYYYTNWLSVNEENRKSFLQDPLCGNPFTYNGFYTLLEVVDKSTKRNWASNLMKKLPFLFVSGKEDPIGNFGKGIEKTVNHLKEDGFTAVDMKLYDKMRHEILLDDQKQQVHQDILHWIEAIVK